MKRTKSAVKKDDIDITGILTRLIEEIINNTQIFGHFDINKIIVCTASNKKNSRGGTYGKLVPLKFENGADILKYKGKNYAMPKIIKNNIQQLYIIYFYIPKFFDLPHIEKLRVIFHELYHISPDFNGDIRRFGKKKISHGSSRDKFNSNFENELIEYYENNMGNRFSHFLKMDMDYIHKNFNNIYSIRMKLPKPINIDKDSESIISSDWS